MKYFLSITILFFSTTFFAQKFSFDIAYSIYQSSAVGESELSMVPLYYGIEGSRSNAFSIQVNYHLAENFFINTGIGLSSYKYKPLTDLQWGSQNQNGSFRDIGFDENGYVENTYLAMPLGIGSILEFGRLKLHPLFQFKFNYSLRESPLIDLNAEINKLFVTGAISMGFTIVERKNLSLILSPFVEMKPYDLESDHAYSDEKLLLGGFSLNLRYQGRENSLDD